MNPAYYFGLAAIILVTPNVSPRTRTILATISTLISIGFSVWQRLYVIA